MLSSSKLENNENTPLISSEQLISYPKALKNFGEIALPFAFSRFIGVGSEFIGAYWLSKLGPAHLAASGLITVCRNFTLSSAIVSIYSTSILQREAIRTDKKENVGKILHASNAFGLLLGLISSGLLYNTGSLLKLLGQSDEAVEITDAFFKAFVLSGGVIATITSVSNQQTAYAIDKPNLVLAINVLRRVIYMGLAYAFIFGELGMPALGAPGLAYASSASAWVDQIIFTLYYKFNSHLSEFGLLRANIIESIKNHFKELSIKSLTMGAQTLNEYFVQLAGTLIIGHKSTIQLAAAEITVQFYNLLDVPISSATQSASLVVSKFNKKHQPSARRIGNVAIVSSLSITVLTAPLFLSIPRHLASIFVGHGPERETILDTSQTILKILAIGNAPDVVRKLSAGTLRGKGYYLTPAMVNILAMTVIGLGVGYAISHFDKLGAIGIYIGFTIGMMIAACVLTPYWLKVSSNNNPSDALNHDESETIILNIEKENVEEENVKKISTSCLKNYLRICSNLWKKEDLKSEPDNENKKSIVWYKKN